MPIFFYFTSFIENTLLHECVKTLVSYEIKSTTCKQFLACKEENFYEKATSHILFLYEFITTVWECEKLVKRVFHRCFKDRWIN